MQQRRRGAEARGPTRATHPPAHPSERTAAPLAPLVPEPCVVSPAAAPAAPRPPLPAPPAPPLPLRTGLWPGARRAPGAHPPPPPPPPAASPHRHAAPAPRVRGRHARAAVALATAHRKEKSMATRSVCCRWISTPTPSLCSICAAGESTATQESRSSVLSVALPSCRTARGREAQSQQCMSADAAVSRGKGLAFRIYILYPNKGIISKVK